MERRLSSDVGFLAIPRRLGNRPTGLFSSLFVEHSIPTLEKYQSSPIPENSAKFSNRSFRRINRFLDYATYNAIPLPLGDVFHGMELFANTRELGRHCAVYRANRFQDVASFARLSLALIAFSRLLWKYTFARVTRSRDDIYVDKETSKNVRSTYSAFSLVFFFFYRDIPRWRWQKCSD